VIERFGGAAALAPQPLERAGIGAVVALALEPARVFHFEEIAALSATKLGTGLVAGNADAAAEAAQLVEIVAHLWC
jgi:hypothetical protein